MKTLTRWLIFVAVFVLVTIGATAEVGTGYGAHLNPNGTTIITTDTGKLRGLPLMSRGGLPYWPFLGIPYAEPPVRFQVKWFENTNLKICISPFVPLLNILAITCIGSSTQKAMVRSAGAGRYNLWTSMSTDWSHQHTFQRHSNRSRRLLVSERVFP